MLEPGDHGSTFAGGPVATAAALAVLDDRRRPGAAARGCGSSARELRAGLAALDGVAEVRGRGLMVGVGLEDGDRRRGASAPTCCERGLVVNVPAPATLRLLPPLVVDSDQIERAVGLIGESLLGSSGVSAQGPHRSPTAAGESSTAERLAAIVDAAERAAVQVIDDAEEEARRHLERGQSRPTDRRRAARRARRADRLADRPGGRRSAASPSAWPPHCRASAPPSAPARRRRPARATQPDSARASDRGRPGRRPRGAEPTELRPERRGSAAGARLLATQMAVSGSSREEIEARLRNGFEIEDTAAILDAILGPED